MVPGLASADNQLSGSQKTQIVDAAGGAVHPASSAAADAESNATLVSRAGAWLWGFNGATWDRIRAGVEGVITSAVGLVNVLPVAKYNATPPILADTQRVQSQCDSSGYLKVAEQYADAAFDNANQVCYTSNRALAASTGAWTRTSSASGGVGTSGVSVKGSAGRVRMIRVTNANVTTGFWLQVHNKATAPVNNDTAVDRVYVPPSVAASTTGLVTGVIDYGESGQSFATGIGLAASSTVGLLTLIGATDAHYTIYWI